MGLLGNTTHQEYYEDDSNNGNYQFVTLDDIISSFMVVYVGEGKLVSKVSRTDVQFHGMRAIQELSYDVLKSFKSLEIEVHPDLKMALPHDYVNYCKVVRVGADGIERILHPTGKTSNPFAVLQYSSGDMKYGTVTHKLNEQKPSDTWSNYSDNPGFIDDSIESNNTGGRYGLEPQYAQSNGTFFIDEARGFVHFGSALVGETIIFKYVSDGLGTDEEMVVHKFAEEAVYKHIMYGVLSGRSGVNENVIARYKKEKFAETRKAKIRLSNIKMEEFTQVLRGISKQIK